MLYYFHRLCHPVYCNAPRAQGVVMKKYLVVFVFAELSGMLSAQEHWFRAQSERAPVKSVTATSELVEAQYDGRYLYPPIQMLDGDLSTVWCEAQQDGPGIGESVTIEFAEPVTFDEIQLVNGFVYKDYYLKNNRVKSFLLTQTAGAHFQQKEYTLQDNTQEWQSIRFELDQTAQTLTLEITGVYDGSTYDDTCIGDIRLLYQGKVIPFGNVDVIKQAQEDNSKQLLASNAAEFKKQFLSLPASGEDEYDQHFVYLKTEKQGKDNGLIIALDSDNEVADMFPCTFTSVTDAASVPDEFFSADYKKGVLITLSSYGCRINEFEYVAFVDWDNKEWGGTYELGNARIIKTRSIAYVEVKTVTLLKIDGKNVFVNGVKYTVLDPEKVFDAHLLPPLK